MRFDYLCRSFGLIICLVILCFCSIAYEAEYYVSPTGNDSSPGSLAQPWRTVQKAANLLTAGDTAYLRGGTYNEFYITFANSGSPGNPIILKNYTGEIPVIDGTLSAPDNVRRDGSLAIPIFHIDGRHYITLDSLTIKRGVIYNVRIGYNAATTNITVRNCDISDYVVWDNSAEIAMIHPSTDDIIIEKNRLHGRQNTGLDDGHNAAGVHIFNGNNLIVRNNEIYDTNIGIYWKSGQDNTKTILIENNLIYQQIRYGICLNHRNIVARNNTISDVTGIGILIFEESGPCDRLISENISLLHNTIINSGSGIVLNRSTSCEGAKDTLVKDNLVYNVTGSALRGMAVWPYYSADNSNTTFDHNLVYSANFSQPIRQLSMYYAVSNIPLSGTGNVQSEPIFRDYENKDLMLQANSPGKKSASDGKDIGANVSIVGIKPSPAPPTL